MSNDGGKIFLTNVPTPFRNYEENTLEHYSKMEFCFLQLISLFSSHDICLVFTEKSQSVKKLGLGEQHP